MPAAKTTGVSSLEEVATGIRDQALTLALAKVAPGRRSVQPVELLERPRFRSAFIQALALGVAQALAANDQRVRAVYAYPAAPVLGASVARDGASLAHLMVLVTSSSAALEVFVGALNRALRVSLSGLIGPGFGQCQPLLDINIVTEQQRQQGLGLTRLLSADQPRPVKLWQRQA
jgi:hypothetical protein